jgi:hypothetical protein
VKSSVDYFGWAACSCAAFLVIGAVPWGGAPPVSFWEECARVATGKGEVVDVVWAGVVLAVASCLFGRILHAGIAGRFGRLAKVPPDLVADYDDIAPHSPAGRRLAPARPAGHTAGMRAQQIAAVVGSLSGALVGLALAGVLAATPLARDYPAATWRASELVVVAAVLIGAAVGLGVLSRWNRLPNDGPEADYDDGPSEA